MKADEYRGAVVDAIRVCSGGKMWKRASLVGCGRGKSSTVIFLFSIETNISVDTEKGDGHVRKAR